MDFIEHNNLKYLKDGWQRELHIISAGPSIRGFNFNNLRSEAIMTLNNSIYHLPSNIRPKYHVYCEPIEVEQANYLKMSQIPYVKRFTVHGYPGWYQIPPFSGEENFAFQVAIKIAEYMGYKVINLYGYDFSFQDGYKYWWSENKIDDDEIKQKSYILDKQRTIFRQFIQKVDKGIKINIVKTDAVISIKDYLNE